jgi:predicted aspartyl protease
MTDVPTIRGRFVAASTDNPKPEFHLPVVRIALADDPKYKPGGPLDPRSIKTDLTALVDTGADGCVIDKAIAESLGLKRLPSREISRTGIKAETTIYDGLLVLMDINYVLAGELPAVPLRDNGLAFDAILGMDLLRRFDVRISRKDDIVSLRYLGE